MKHKFVKAENLTLLLPSWSVVGSTCVFSFSSSSSSSFPPFLFLFWKMLHTLFIVVYEILKKCPIWCQSCFSLTSIMSLLHYVSVIMYFMSLSHYVT